ncbi:MAG: pyridoxine 5'-phosphate synthase [Pseudomonadota bacterium]
MHHLRLGVNIDHVATLRNARGGAHPDPVAAALLAQQAGADGITAHLREDRRHITDADMVGLKHAIALPLNFEMAATAEMQRIALEIRPHACCLVPESRAERTTEGGLNVVAQEAALREYIAPLVAVGIRISLFIDPQAPQLEAAKRVGADIVELHTGRYAQFDRESAEFGEELALLQRAATLGNALGLEMHAGHGLTFDNVSPVAAMAELHELNIGHFLMGEAMFMGLPAAIARMRQLMDEARA